MQNMDSRTDTVGTEAQNAAINSLHYAYEGMEKSELFWHPNTIAEAVRLNTVERLTEQAKRNASPEDKPHKPKPLGAYVNGTLKFQSRDHDAIHNYAADKMRRGEQVWVAPIGSFVTDKVQTGKAGDDA